MWKHFKACLLLLVLHGYGQFNYPKSTFCDVVLNDKKIDLNLHFHFVGTIKYCSGVDHCQAVQPGPAHFTGDPQLRS